MMTEEYCFTIGENGQESLDIIEKTFNPQTEYFLKKHGLKAGMKVLDIGCGLGNMTQIIANTVGSDGKVIAIDNNDQQLKAASAMANGRHPHKKQTGKTHQR